MAKDENQILDTLEAIGDHHTLSDRVYHQLRDAIIDGRLSPGQWLRQETLAQELGTSQLPVREAIRRLAAEGLAVRIPYKGVRVVEYSPEDIIDMFQVRMYLESMAIRYSTPLISTEELGKLEKNLDEAAQITRQDQMNRRRDLNTEFHLTICRASGHRYLISQIETMWSGFPSTLLYEGMRRQEELSQPRLERENHEHRLILQALKERDARMAEEQVQRHTRNLSQELAEVLNISPDQVDVLLS